MLLPRLRRRSPPVLPLWRPRAPEIGRRAVAPTLIPVLLAVMLASLMALVSVPAAGAAAGAGLEAVSATSPRPSQAGQINATKPSGQAEQPAAAAPRAAQVSGGSPAATTAWITLEGRRVLEIRSAAGAQTPAGVAARGSARLRQLAESTAVQPEQLVVREDPPYSMIGLLAPDGTFTPQLAVDDRAALAFGTSRVELAERYRDQMRAAIRRYRSSHTPTAWLRSTALAALVLGVYLLWLRGQSRLHERLRHWISSSRSAVLRGVQLGGNTVLDAVQERASLLRLLRLLHWGLLLLASYLLIPLLLGLFPPTQVIAEGLRGHLRGVLSGLLEGAVDSIPNLLTIALILVLTRGLMRACIGWFGAIERGQLRISGFYPEWARPTGRLVAATVLLAGLVVAFPYIPGSGSRAFQGAGLFVGLLAALGSSAVATNVISGVMLIYTRAFQEGDRVEINGVTGTVQDRNLLVTRIQTPRNELVSLPNATVISSAILNFSFSRRENQPPVAIATTITIGYDVPWRQVHQLMLTAAAAVEGIAAQPPPKVLQTALNDFHISYELNASVSDVSRYRETLSDLLASLQDHFAAAGVEILSPAYQAYRRGDRSTVPSTPSAAAP